MSKKTPKPFMCTQHVLSCSFRVRTGKSMNNLLSYYGLVDARISASEKDLPVCTSTTTTTMFELSNRKLSC